MYMDKKIKLQMYIKKFDPLNLIFLLNIKN